MAVEKLSVMTRATFTNTNIELDLMKIFSSRTGFMCLFFFLFSIQVAISSGSYSGLRFTFNERFNYYLCLKGRGTSRHFCEFIETSEKGGLIWRAPCSNYEQFVEMDQKRSEVAKS